jgi:deazaflavin-dependent oxidoreductase (nitroreductase family)
VIVGFRPEDMPGHRVAREHGSLARIGGMADPPQDVQVTNARVIEEFRANDGVLGPPFSGGPMMLLTTTGRRTGRRHTTPLMYVPLGDDGGSPGDPGDPGDRFAGGLMVIASNAGGAVHPDWYLNLEALEATEATPAATVELGTETFEATAETARGDDRIPLWDALVAGYPFFRGHQARTGREIPLVVLRRARR